MVSRYVPQDRGNSLRDGMSTAADWFDMPKAETNGKPPDKGLGAFMAATDTQTHGTQATTTTVILDPNIQSTPTIDAEIRQPQLSPTIAEVSALIQKGDFDAAADLIRSFPEAERKVLELELKAQVKKRAREAM